MLAISRQNFEPEVILLNDPFVLAVASVLYNLNVRIEEQTDGQFELRERGNAFYHRVYLIKSFPRRANGKRHTSRCR